jgi:hypothetical protein
MPIGGLRSLAARGAAIGVSVTCLGLALGLAADDAWAAPLARTATLDWHRGRDAAGCPDASAIGASVEARLGRPVFVGRDEAEAVVSGAIEQVSPSRFAVRISIADRAGRALGTRELVLDVAPPAGAAAGSTAAATSTRPRPSAGEGCTALAAPIALILAVMLDPDAPVLDAPAPPPAPVELRLHLGLGAGTGLGAVPGPFVDLSLRAHARPPGAPSLLVAFAVDLPRGADAPDGARAVFTRFAVALAWAPRLHQSPRAELFALVGAQAALVRFAGQQFDESRAGTVMSFAAQAGLELRLPLGSTWAAFIATELGLPLRRERFYFVDPDGVTRHDVYRQAPVAARLVAGVTWAAW